MEASLAGEIRHFGEHVGTTAQQDVLDSYCQRLYDKFPLQRPDVEKLYAAAVVAFPRYVKHWANHPDVTGRTPLLQERVFSVPYQLPSGRTVQLRGKWDAVDLISGVERPGVYLFETKTKSDPDEDEIQRQLLFDLQTCLYLIAMREDQKDCLGQLAACQGDSTGWLATHGTDEQSKAEVLPTQGVRYNVVRRPLSGGKGSISRHQAKGGTPCSSCGGTGRTKKQGKTCTPCAGRGKSPYTPEESWDSFYSRLGAVIDANPADFFRRWTVSVTPADLERFEREFLHPCLENFCDDWEWWSDSALGMLDPYDFGGRGVLFPAHAHRHFRKPYGLYDPLAEGVTGDLDFMMDTGNRAGTIQTQTLFPELEEG